MDRPAPQHVVVAGALRRGSQVLLAHRSPAREYFPDVWDLPGGHVEAGEDPRAALVRELAEELGVDAHVTGDPAARLVEGDDLVVDVWRVDDWRGEVENRAPEEHDDLAWCSVDDLTRRPLAHPDLEALLRSLLVP